MPSFNQPLYHSIHNPFAAIPSSHDIPLAGGEWLTLAAHIHDGEGDGDISSFMHDL